MRELLQEEEGSECMYLMYVFPDRVKLGMAFVVGLFGLFVRVRHACHDVCIFGGI